MNTSDCIFGEALIFIITFTIGQEEMVRPQNVRKEKSTGTGCAQASIPAGSGIV